MKTTTYNRIMDAHGVESFKPLGKSNFPFRLRADLNRQRHAIYYMIDLSESEAKEVTNLLDKHKFKKACRFLKSFGKRLLVPKDHCNSLKLIPNDQLDPYH